MRNYTFTNKHKIANNKFVFDVSYEMECMTFVASDELIIR